MDLLIGLAYFVFIAFLMFLPFWLAFAISPVLGWFAIFCVGLLGAFSR